MNNFKNENKLLKESLADYVERRKGTDSIWVFGPQIVLTFHLFLCHLNSLHKLLLG